MPNGLRGKKDRERFNWCRPMGWGEVLLRNFVDNPDDIRP